MKKIVASVSLVALGASSVHALDMSGSSGLDTSKPWNVSASLRGFYDDNPNTAPDGSSFKTDSFGFEISPSLGLHLSSDQTDLKARYTYSAKYYDKKIGTDQENWDQQHIFDASLSHAFSPRYQANVTESFVIGQEPDALRAGNVWNTTQVISGDNIRNYATINLNGQLTPLLGFQVGYYNAYFDYAGTGPGFVGPFVVASPAGSLNRLEHTIHLDSRWQIMPDTVGIFGYQFRYTDYTSDELVAGNVFAPATLRTSDQRNSYSHFVYVGGEHSFTPELTGAAQAGVQYTDYYNDPSDRTDLGPYVQLSATYAYRPDGTLKVGFTEQQTATDLVGDNSGNLIDGMQASTVFASINQQILTKFFASVIASYQNSIFNGSSPIYDGQSENYYAVGLNLEYRLNPNFSANVGYNYDKLDSDIQNPDRSFSRNRVYVGVTASY